MSMVVSHSVAVVCILAKEGPTKEARSSWSTHPGLSYSSLVEDTLLEMFLLCSKIRNFCVDCSCRSSTRSRRGFGSCLAPLENGMIKTFDVGALSYIVIDISSNYEGPKLEFLLLFEFLGSELNSLLFGVLDFFLKAYYKIEIFVVSYNFTISFLSSCSYALSSSIFVLIVITSAIVQIFKNRFKTVIHTDTISQVNNLNRKHFVPCVHFFCLQGPTRSKKILEYLYSRTMHSFRLNNHLESTSQSFIISSMI